MRKNYRAKALMRAALVIGAVVLIASGVTMAALQSQPVKLTGNSIQTATTGLQISLDGSSYGATLGGFNFTGLVPGGSAVPAAGYGFYLKNSGSADVVLRLSVTSQIANPDNADLSKVRLILALGSGSSQTFALADLVNAAASGGLPVTITSKLTAGTAQQYTIKASMEADAVTGQSAALNNIDLAFTGVAAP